MAKKRIICEVCGKYEAVQKTFRKDGVKSIECTWCADLSDSAVAIIARDGIDPVTYHDIDYDEMSADDLTKFKDDLYEMILEKHGNSDDINRMLECERALTLKENG